MLKKKATIDTILNNILVELKHIEWCVDNHIEVKLTIDNIAGEISILKRDIE